MLLADLLLVSMDHSKRFTNLLVGSLLGPNYSGVVSLRVFNDTDKLVKGVMQWVDSGKCGVCLCD